MFRQLATAVLITGATVLSCSAAAVTFDYKGLTNQLQGDGTGIFNVPSAGAAVTGSLTFDPEAFSPNPVAPPGQPYLVPFWGGAGSVMMRLEDAGGKATVYANSAYLLLCAQCTTPWNLQVNADNLSFNVQMNASNPVTFTPGSSIFNLKNQLEAGVNLSVLLNDPNSSLGFDITNVVSNPEPGTTGLLLLAAGAAAVLYRKRWTVSGRSKV